MCFAPHRCALFRHLNFKECSETASFCNFWLRHVLRAATTCTFSTSQCASRYNAVRFSTSNLPKVLWVWCALHILTLTRASGHNRVHCFNSSTAKRAPTLRCFWHSDLETRFAPQLRAIFHRTRRFSEPAFQPSEATTHWKNTVLRDFSTFSRACIFFRLALSLLWSSLFCLSLLWLFPPVLFICPYCRKFDV